MIGNEGFEHPKKFQLIRVKKIHFHPISLKFLQEFAENVYNFGKKILDFKYFKGQFVFL